MFQVKVFKTHTSLCIVIPKGVANAHSIKEGDEIILSIAGKATKVKKE